MSRQDVGRYFIFIKNKVSSDWKDLAWCLGFDTPDIDNIEDKRQDHKSRCMELLQEWHKRKGHKATIHVLMEALQEAELQLVVDSLKEKYPELNEKPNSSKQLLTAKQPMEGACGRQQKYPVQTMSDKQSMDKPTAFNTGQVKQSVVQPKRKDTKVRPIRVGQPWVRKVRFGGRGSGRGEFNRPLGVAVSHDNEVYIADYDNSRIQVFTMDGVYIREFKTTLPGETGQKLKPQDVAVDRNDNLWVVGGKQL